MNISSVLFFLPKIWGQTTKIYKNTSNPPNPAVGVGTAKSSKRPTEGPGVAWEAGMGIKFREVKHWTAGDAELDCPGVFCGLFRGSPMETWRIFRCLAQHFCSKFSGCSARDSCLVGWKGLKSKSLIGCKGWQLR